MIEQPARVPARTSPATTAAYVRIYEEQQPRLVAYARSLTRNTWAAEDLVAEAHFRVWRRLSAGHEIDNVPAYLMTTVRHLASSAAGAAHETPRDPQVPEQASAGHAADPAEQVSATDLLVRVLGELPERWVRALWLAEAEGQPLETVGRQIGAKQGATAVLLHRAREGMRQAFLRSQTEAPDDPACEVHWARMPAYVRGSATARQSERLLAHVDTCEGCRGRLAVLMRANDRLPALVGPALLVLAVGGGGGRFLASLTAGSAGSAGSAFVHGGQGLLRTARAAGPRTKAALASGTAAAAAVAVVLTLGLNESPTTVTAPERAPVARGPVAGPSVGVGEGSGEGSSVGDGRDGRRGRGLGLDRGEAVGVVVIGAGSAGDAGGASEVPDPGPGPLRPAPEVPGPGPDPVDPAPRDPAPRGEDPEPPGEPMPAPPKEQQPEPEPEPGAEKPKPGTPGEETPVPKPKPDPKPPAPAEPSDPAPGDDCGRPYPHPHPHPHPGTSVPRKGVGTEKERPKQGK
ncbi:sigma-70 family RNA polymerase sigma factor [Streptomyces sp. NPDC091972]|uniref:sigma-70 family RNA polymerase sigma factor n=1 Tax=Streptomyces sp. NPDC091972 TaxID=3366007 RepID=UPI0038290069